MRFIFPVLIFAWRHVVTRRTPIGRKEMENVRFHGGPMIRASEGRPRGAWRRRLTARVTASRTGSPVIDGTAYDVANVVWATGFRQVFDWIDLPVFGEDGWPIEYRGVVKDASRTLLLRAVVPVRVRLDGPARCRPRRRLRRRQDRRPGCRRSRKARSACLETRGDAPPYPPRRRCTAWAWSTT